MKTILSLNCLISVVCLSVVTSEVAGQSYSYTITDLGTLGGASSYASSINDAGDVAGTSSKAWPDQRGYAFLWTREPRYSWSTAGMHALPFLGGAPYEGAVANAVSEDGVVVGASTTDEGFERACIWSGGGVSDLGVLYPNDPSLMANLSKAYAISGSDVVGDSFDPYAWVPRAARFSSNVLDLGVFEDTTAAEARGNNSYGQVVGASWVQATEQGNEPSVFHACLWLPQPAYGLGVGVHDLGSLGLESGGTGFDINDAGVAVGESFGLGFWVDLRESPHTMRALPGILPGREGARAMAVNRNGSIVGWGEDLRGDLRATVWLNHCTAIDLNTQIPPIDL